eukprot:scaffold87451_cov30-Tisochrysis_lutea.AAC.1
MPANKRAHCPLMIGAIHSICCYSYSFSRELASALHSTIPMGRPSHGRTTPYPYRSVREPESTHSIGEPAPTHPMLAPTPCSRLPHAQTGGQPREGASARGCLALGDDPVAL